MNEYVANMALSNKVVWASGVPWKCDNSTLFPLPPPHTLGILDRKSIQKAMDEAGAHIAIWNDTWDTSEGPWWWVCADRRDYDISQFTKGIRYNIRSGFKKCIIRKINIQEFETQGYSVYEDAHIRYGTQARLKTREQFIAEIRRMAQFSGRETWGAFYNEELVSFVSCIIIDKIVLLSWGKAKPKYFSLCMNNALYYEVTRHYLIDREFSYVTDGFRSINHDSNMQNFLIGMGYRKIYCPLRIELAPLLNFANKFGTPPQIIYNIIPAEIKSFVNKLKTISFLSKNANICSKLYPSKK
jgi:hypothetical protein